MDFSEEQIRDAVDLKEKTLQKIEKYQKEIRLLEKQFSILDSVIKQSSFTKASSLPEPQYRQSGQQENDSIPITRNGHDEIIANAYVTPEQVSIVLDESLDVDENTPPFKSFFLGRIIEEMKRKDGADEAIPSGAAIDYVVNKNGPNIREIIVRNYHRKERLDEIISTAGWSLSKMIENVNR